MVVLQVPHLLGMAVRETPGELIGSHERQHQLAIGLLVCAAYIMRHDPVFSVWVSVAEGAEVAGIGGVG